MFHDFFRMLGWLVAHDTTTQLLIVSTVILLVLKLALVIRDFVNGWR